MENVKPKKSDKYIPYYFVAFFIFLALADGMFVYLATSTHTGVVKEQAYEKGLDYNQVVAAKAAQDKLGWESTIIYDKGIIVASLLDNDKQPLQAEVQLFLQRPTQDGEDFTLPLNPNADGTYGAAVTFPAKGQWDVTFVGKRGENSYQKRQRIIVE